MANNIDKPILDIFNKWGPIMIESMREELLKNGSIASSRLYNSLTYSVKKKVDEYVLSFDSEEYGKWVESGRKPGKFPPVGAIKKWTKYKGIPEKAAFPIAMKIYKFGIKPKPFMLPSIRKNRDGLLKDLIKFVKSETLNIVKKELRFK